MWQYVLIPVHRAGWPFAIAPIAVGIALAAFWFPALWIGVVLGIACALFFRDPVRVTPARPGLVVSPADGIVSSIVEAPPPAALDMGAEPLVRVSIFLSVLDVHINRIPADGTITHLHYHKGRYLNAALDKASEENERQLARLDTADGKSIGFVQIAGLIARRIVCELRVGQDVRAGERFGLIRFGSRCDVYLPAGAVSLVAEGQRMVGGETVIADLNSIEGQRPGEVR